MTRLRTRYTQRLPTAPGLRLDVPFFEGSGEIAHDLSGKDNHGTLHNVTWTSSEQGPVGSFNGSSSYSDHGNKHWLNITDAITIEARVKTANTGGYIMAKRDGDNAQYAVYIYHNTIAFVFWDGTQIDIVPGSSTSIVDNQWHHVGVTVSGTSAKGYIDGVLELTPTLDNTIQSFLTVPVYIGARKSGVGTTFHFNGTIDEVRIYNRALSAEAQKRRYEQPWYDYCRGS